jgi:hypothetical protein
MPSSKLCSLACILRDAGFSLTAADEISAAIDRLGIAGQRSDDVADLLFRWRTAACRRRLIEAREKFRDIVKGVILAKVEQEKGGSLTSFQADFEYAEPWLDVAELDGHACARLGDIIHPEAFFE